MAKDAKGHGSDAHQSGVAKIGLGAYKPGDGPGTYKFGGVPITIATYMSGGGKVTGQVGTTGQSTSELTSIWKQHQGGDRHSQNVRRAVELEMMNRPVMDRIKAGYSK